MHGSRLFSRAQNTARLVDIEASMCADEALQFAGIHFEGLEADLRPTANRDRAKREDRIGSDRRRTAGADN